MYHLHNKMTVNTERKDRREYLAYNSMSNVITGTMKI